MNIKGVTFDTGILRSLSTQYPKDINKRAGRVPSTDMSIDRRILKGSKNTSSTSEMKSGIEGP